MPVTTRILSKKGEETMTEKGMRELKQHLLDGSKICYMDTSLIDTRAKQFIFEGVFPNKKQAEVNPNHVFNRAIGLNETDNLFHKYSLESNESSNVREWVVNNNTENRMVYLGFDSSLGLANDRLIERDLGVITIEEVQEILNTIAQNVAKERKKSDAVMDFLNS